MKNKFLIILILIIIIIGICIFYFIYNNNSNNVTENSVTNYTTNKTSSSTETNNLNVSISEEKTVEEEISRFSTKIYSTDSARQNNINITCTTLNDTIIDIGTTFSFCDIIGKSTTQKGYQEADIYDREGNKVKGLGGGNCQVSTTLYNAVLAVPGLVVTERHEHSNKVPYIESGKDAAVAYGSYDLKFRNDYGYKIKIKAEASASSVNIILYRISTTY